MFSRMITTAALALVFAFAGTANAQDTSGCEKFKWSVARERAWFAAGPKQIDAGANLMLTDQAYVVSLRPTDAAGFVMPPERVPKPGAFGATLAVAAIDKPGLYEITLSDEAWIDVIQNSARVKSTDFSGQKTCLGVRKSVRFAFATGPLTVQISNAEGATIAIAIAPAQ
jgi:hypothetical protein